MSEIVNSPRLRMYLIRYGERELSEYGLEQAAQLAATAEYSLVSRSRMGSKPRAD